jgi:hypothetical protein
MITLTSVKCFAKQEISNDITLNGEIKNAEDNSAVPFVHIVNTSTSKGTASNSEGRFTIQMSATDTLLFSAIGFEKYIFMLSEDINTKSINMTIVLDASSMELEPIKIFAYKDEQSFKRAIIEMELPEEKSNRMQLDGFNYGPRRESKVTALSPISFIASRVSKKAIEKRKYAKITAEYDHWMTSVYQKYNPKYVQKVTGLPKDEVDDFMKFCKLGDSFISLSSEYEIVIAIQECHSNYSTEAPILDTLRDN